MIVIWSARAERDFQTLARFTAAHSVKGAKRVGSRILRRVDDLAETPHQGSLLPNGLRRLEVTRTPYLLIFRIDRDAARIVRILHSKRGRRS